VTGPRSRISRISRLKGFYSAIFAFSAVKNLIREIPEIRGQKNFPGQMRDARRSFHLRWEATVGHARRRCRQSDLKFGVLNPGQRSLTHSPWATIVRPYGTFSVCCAVRVGLRRLSRPNRNSWEFALIRVEILSLLPLLPSVKTLRPMMSPSTGLGKLREGTFSWACATLRPRLRNLGPLARGVVACAPAAGPPVNRLCLYLLPAENPCGRSATGGTQSARRSF
jgi:hypothetical protein